MMMTVGVAVEAKTKELSPAKPFYLAAILPVVVSRSLQFRGNFLSLRPELLFYTLSCTLFGLQTSGLA